MKTSTIQFNIQLDGKNVPEKIEWDANDKPEGGLTETKAISISVWDHSEKNTLRIDLWTKDMPVDDMKRFYIESIGGMAQSVLRATGDEFMAQEMELLCDKLVEYLRKNS
ncbi:MAG TPA: gliding motility protein GldC [Cyclobacteriaceae bacterium]|nr:gliding motility protein GldC [Cyclobacteriaceae bacterium]